MAEATMLVTDITRLIIAAAGLITAFAGAFLIPLIKAKTTAQQQAVIKFLVASAVTAAEQIYTKNGMGAEKKAYVIKWLADRGVTLDEATLDALIESAVYALKNGVF